MLFWNNFCSLYVSLSFHLSFPLSFFSLSLLSIFPPFVFTSFLPVHLSFFCLSFPPSFLPCLLAVHLFFLSVFTSFLTAELPTPLKKRRLCPLDACLSESSTPYGSPCATPTRADLLDTPGTPLLLATPPRMRHEDPGTETTPCTPTNVPVTPGTAQGTLSIQGPYAPFSVSQEVKTHAHTHTHTPILLLL